MAAGPSPTFPGARERMKARRSAGSMRVTKSENRTAGRSASTQRLHNISGNRAHQRKERNIMRIGISVLTHEGQNIWENGLGQNVFFLAQLLRSLPVVTDVILLNCGDQGALPVEAEQAAFGLPLVPMRAATDRIDVAIEMGGGLDIEWVDYLCALGKKVVFMCCGQPYVGLIEPTVFRKRGFFSRAQRCDEVWILPKDRSLVPMLEALHRCPAFEVPYLWDPVFVERRAQVVKDAGYRFGYQPVEREMEGDTPTPRPLRVAVFEPNISVVKCFAIPALVCDTAFREQPAAIARLNLLNTVQMREQVTFTFLMRSLDLYKNERVNLDKRHDFAGYMSQFADVVVSHQWRNDQNFLYLDTLYGGYPLVHNSPWLKDLGYYYEGSDIPAGAKQLLRIAHEHDVDHANYLRRSRDFIATLSPLHAANRERYAQRLLQMSAKTAARAAAFAH
jgi:hypothetical protein